MNNNRHDVLNRLAKRIKNARIQAGLTQENLAELLNVSRVTIGKYESGEIEPKLKNLVLIAEALHVSADYLLGIESAGPFTNQLSADAIAALDRFIQEVQKQTAAESKRK